MGAPQFLRRRFLILLLELHHAAALHAVHSRKRLLRVVRLQFSLAQRPRFICIHHCRAILSPAIQIDFGRAEVVVADILEVLLLRVGKLQLVIIRHHYILILADIAAARANQHTAAGLGHHAMIVDSLALRARAH